MLTTTPPHNAPCLRVACWLQSGLDYAVLAGGDVAPLGADAITELHRVFDWAEGNKKGLILFIDEASIRTMRPRCYPFQSK